MTAVTKMPDFRRMERSRAAVDEKTGAPAPQESPDGVILVNGAALTPEPVDWLWLHWLALGKLHVLAGPPGQGKTTIALAWASLVSAGGRWPDGRSCEPGNVLIWSGEDDPTDTLLPRLIGMKAERSRVHFITGTRLAGKTHPFDPARDMPKLMTAAGEIGDVRLLVVDPVVSTVAADSHNNGDVRRALQPLVDLASALRAAVVGISHFTKGSASREPVERVTGSLAFGAVARVVLCAVKAKVEDGGEERRILARAKSNLGPDGGGFAYSIEQEDVAGFPGISASVIRWGAPLVGTARELLAEAEQDDEAGDGPGDAAQWLRELLSSGAMPAREVKHHADDAGFAWRTVQRAMQKAGVQSRRGGFGQPAEWFLGSSRTTVAPVAPAPEAGADGANDGADGDSDADAQRV
jgi:hypothetical protein